VCIVCEFGYSRVLLAHGLQGAHKVKCARASFAFAARAKILFSGCRGVVNRRSEGVNAANPAMASTERRGALSSSSVGVVARVAGVHGTLTFAQDVAIAIVKLSTREIPSVQIIGAVQAQIARAKSGAVGARGVAMMR
jgi:hypothetical protein